MNIDLPGPPIYTRYRLLNSLAWREDDRDRRIANLALSYLTPAQQRFLRLNFTGGIQFDQQIMDIMELDYVAYKTLEATSYDDFLVILWKLGVITRLPQKTKNFSDQHGDKKSARKVGTLGDSKQGYVVFACLACGRRMRAPVGKTGIISCPGCFQQSRLRVNNGCRVGFDKVKTADQPPRKIYLPPLQEAYEVLQVLPTTPIAEIKKAYLGQLMAYHPDKVFNHGPLVRDAAEELTKQLNSAWALISAHLAA